jgi:hypothetical protein
VISRRVREVCDASQLGALAPVLLPATNVNMAVSFDLREEIEAARDPSTYEIPNEQDIRSMNAGQVNALLERQ